MSDQPMSDDPNAGRCSSVKRLWFGSAVQCVLAIRHAEDAHRSEGGWKWRDGGEGVVSPDNPARNAEAEMPLPVRIAYLAMYACSEEQRSEVMQHFCKECLRYTGPDERCQCWRDE